MTELFAPNLFERLRMLARPFVWGRKGLHVTVAEELQAAGAAHTELVGKHRHTCKRLDDLVREHAQLSERHDAVIAELNLLHQDRAVLERTLEETNIHRREARNDWDRERDILEVTAAQLRAELTEKSEAIEALRRTVDQQLGAHAELRQQFMSLEQRHGDTRARFQLVSRLLAAQPLHNAGRARFRQLLSEHEARVAQNLSWSSAESRLIAELTVIDQELDRLLAFPELATHTVAGVVGGFNSGKSEFINSFIQDREIRLAIGVKPVTAIPTYVTSKDTSEIRGFTVAGGYIGLSVQDFKRMSHIFLKSFDFDLKRLMPFMCLGTPMDPMYFSQLCLLDTPGYNPPATASAYSQHDRRTAVQAAQQSDVLLWLIALDVNGTVPASDIDFIRDIGLERRAVHIVLNKADLRADDELREIISDVRAVLDQAAIQVTGISAYSSTKRRVLLHDGQSLFEFLAHFNRADQAKDDVTDRLEGVFNAYVEAIKTQIAAIHAQRQSINDLELDALEFGGEEVYHKVLHRVNQLEVMLNTTLLEKAVHDTRVFAVGLRDALRAALKEVA
jgi:GTP-binding protein EngB required for normal cell division